MYVSIYIKHPDISETIKIFLFLFQIYYKFLDFDTQNISFFLDNQFCPLLERKNFGEICKKIKDLLNVKDITELTENFGDLCTDTKTEKSDPSI